MKKLIAFLLTLLLVANCGKQNEQTNSKDSLAVVQKPGKIQYEVATLDEAGLKQLIAQRNGKILLLNVWATWCEPCREEFPDLIKLASDYKNSNVEVVGLSADYPDEVDSKIVPFLEKYQCNFKIYVQNFEDDAKLIQLLNQAWNGALPATFIFDQDGKQQMFLTGMRSYDDFKQEVEKVRNPH